MTRYILSRILFFIPSVAVISLLAFGMIRSLPGNTFLLLTAGASEDAFSPTASAESTRNLRKTASDLGADLPVFYIEITRGSMPRDASFEWNPAKKKTLEKWTLDTGNYPAAKRWYEFLEQSAALLSRSGGSESVSEAKKIIHALSLSETEEETRKLYTELKEIVYGDSTLKSHKGWLSEGISAMEARYDRRLRHLNFLPAVHFHSRCAFGLWLFGNGADKKGLIRGDFGHSLIDGKKVTASLYEKVWLTVALSLASLLLTYLISVPLGTWLAVYRGSAAEKVISSLLFLGFSLPSFWVATLAIVWFAGGDGLNRFAAYGTGGLSLNMHAEEFFQTLFRHFTLPVFVWTYGGIAFVTKQTQTALLQASESQYFRAAVAHGIPMRNVIWKHLWPNSLRPLITMGANILPGLIGGSVVLETIFSLPGMGEWLYRAYFFRDYPVIMAVLFLGSVLTLTGYLLSDILLALTDPKIRYSEYDK